MDESVRPRDENSKKLRVLKREFWFKGKSMNLDM